MLQKSRKSWNKHAYYRKRGSASYIVREVLSVREREREIQRARERERRKWRHHFRAKIGDEFHFPLPKIRTMGHIHLRGKWRPRTPRWYNAALTHTKWMGNLSSPTLNSNCENRRACFCQTSPGMHVWGVLVPIRTVFMRSNWPRG